MVFLPTLSPKPSQLSVWAAQPFPIQSPRCNINTRQQRHGSPRWTEGFLSLSSLDNIFSFHVVRLAVQLGQSDERMVLMQLPGQLPDSARAVLLHIVLLSLKKKFFLHLLLCYHAQHCRAWNPTLSLSLQHQRYNQVVFWVCGSSKT